MRGARLACVKPAASVRSEPGSNSQVGIRSGILDRTSTRSPTRPPLEGRRELINVNRRRISSQRSEPRRTGSLARITPSTFLFLPIQLSKNPKPTRLRTLPPKSERFAHPFGHPSEATFNTFSNRLASPFFKTTKPSAGAKDFVVGSVAAVVGPGYRPTRWGRQHPCRKIFIGLGENSRPSPHESRKSALRACG